MFGDGVFWSSVELTGNQTKADTLHQHLKFWSSVELTGNQTNNQDQA